MKAVPSVVRRALQLEAHKWQVEGTSRLYSPKCSFRVRIKAQNSEVTAGI
jgi:hypothetical protein